MKKIMSEDNIRVVTVRSEIAAGTRGASLGVDALKIASLDMESNYFSRFEEEKVDTVNDILFDSDTYTHAKFIDGVHTMENRVCNTVSDQLKGGFFPIVLAGDHSTAAGTIFGIRQTYPDKKLGVIWIDAHADIHTPYTTPSGNMHGMPLAMVTGIDNLAHKVNNPSPDTITYWGKIKSIAPSISLHDIVFIGARDLENPETAVLKENNIRNYTVAEIREKGAPKIATEALQQLEKCDLIYVSFDVDSMDTRISMGTGTPVANGLTVAEAKALNITLIKDPRLIAWEMVEVNPTLDTENKMAEVAFEILEATTNTLLSEKKTIHS